MTEPATLQVVTSPEPYRLAAPVWVRLFLINTGQQMIEIGVSTPEKDFDLDLRFAGHPVPRTDYGAGLRDSLRKMSSRELSPGETYQADIELSEVFVIDRPGRYVLRVAARVNLGLSDERARIISDPVALDIVAH